MLSTSLKNGLRVLAVENRAAPVVAIQVWVKVGSADETPAEAGLAHVHEHMLFKGTARRGVGQIAAEVEGVGGDINAYTSYDQTVYHVTMPSRDFAIGMDILADAIQRSAFDAAELGRELEVVLEEVRRGRDTPSRVVSENLFTTAFKVHPYARPIIGTVESVSAFTRPMILDFYRRWYRPDNMCLVVAGDVAEAEVVRQAEALFGEQPAAPIPARPRTPEPPQGGLRAITEVQNIQENHLGIGWRGLPFRHEDTGALDLLSTFLGNGDSSRLYRRVKRELALVNQCYAYCYTPLDPGMLVVGATLVDTEPEAAFRALLTETYRLRYELPSDAEVEKARTMLISEEVYTKETVQGIANKVGFYQLIADGAEYEAVYQAQLRATTPARIREVARKYLTSDQLTVSALLVEARRGQMTEAKVRAMVEEVERGLEAEYRPRVYSLGAERIASVTLPSGARLHVREDRAVPVVSVRAAAQGGLLCERPEELGVSALVGNLLVRGTERYAADQISEILDATNASLAGISGRNSLGLAGTFLAEFWDRGFDVFMSCLTEPSFGDDELELERQTQIEELKGRRDNLAAVCFDQLAKGLYPTHPYGNVVSGTVESVSALTRAQIEEAYAAQLDTRRLSLAVVGAVDVSDTIARVERALEQRKSRPGRQLELPPADPPLDGPRSLVQRVLGKEQVHLALGFRGVSLTDPRRWPLEILSSVLSGQGGRLFLELRDRQSLAYSVSSSSVEGIAPGYFAVYIGTAPEKLEQAERGLKQELARVVEAGITEEELARAQRYLVGTHDVSLQRSSSRAGSMALSDAYGLGVDEYARYAPRIEAVTRADVQAVAREVIDFSRMVRSLVATGA